MEIVKLACEAMATRFEIVLQGAKAVSLRAAGEEAIEEIHRLESQLSLYRQGSDIDRVNSRAAFQWVRVAPLVYNLLKQAQELQRATQGTFDITIAPLVRCWGFMGDTGHSPDDTQVSHARQQIGMQHVAFDDSEMAVRFDQQGVMIDLGAIGKGLAIDRAAELLREAGVTSALIHGGTSTVYGIGKPLDGESWKIAIEKPCMVNGNPTRHGEDVLATIVLEDTALSVSAVWGRAFQSGGKTYGHVIDPRTGTPVSHAILSAVALPSATESDALSTALLVLGREGLETIAQHRSEARTLVVTPRENNIDVFARGIQVKAANL